MIFLCFTPSLNLFGYEIESVDLLKEKQTKMMFYLSKDAWEKGNYLPVSYSVDGQRMHLVFREASLSPFLSQHLSRQFSDPLVENITFETSNSEIHATVQFASTVDAVWLSQLVQKRNKDGIFFPLKYQSPSEQKRLEAEGVPLQFDKIDKPNVSLFRPTNFFALLLAVMMAAVCTFLFIKLTQRSKVMSKMRGSRKYLIEHLSTYQLSPKSSVSLLKIGEEFVLIGVTPSQVNHLSSLPMLEKIYHEENRFERETFKEAVSQEANALRR